MLEQTQRIKRTVCLNANYIILTTDYCVQQIWRWICSLYRLVISKGKLSPIKKKNQTSAIPIKASCHYFSRFSGNKLVSVLIFLLAEPIHSWPLQAGLLHLIQNWIWASGDI